MTGKITGNSLKRTLLRSGAGSLALKVASTALSLLMAIVLARTLGAEGYGVYAYIMAIVTLLALPAQAGLPTLVVRETAKAQANQQWGLMRGLWQWCSRLALILSILLLIGTGLIAWLFSEKFAVGQLNTLYLGLLLVPLVALGNLRGAALRGLRKVVLGQFPENVIRPGLFVLLMIIAYGLMRENITPALAMGMHVVAAALAFAIGGWFLLRARPSQLKASPSPQYEVRLWWRTILPLALISGISIVNAQADILMLGWFRTAEEVGIYRVAASSVGLIGFGMTALTSVVSPHFARLYAQSDMVRLQYVVTRSAQAMLLLALPVFLVFIIFGEQLLGMAFGKEFSAGYLLLVIMSIGQMVSVGMGSVGALLNMTGHERDTAKVALTSAIINIILNAVLIPISGMIGASIATAISIAIYNFMLFTFVRKRIGISSTFMG